MQTLIIENRHGNLHFSRDQKRDDAAKCLRLDRRIDTDGKMGSTQIIANEQGAPRLSPGKSPKKPNHLNKHHRRTIPLDCAQPNENETQNMEYTKWREIIVERYVW